MENVFPDLSRRFRLESHTRAGPILCGRCKLHFCRLLRFPRGHYLQERSLTPLGTFKLKPKLTPRKMFTNKNSISPKIGH
jgi:hypothetical protein